MLNLWDILILLAVACLVVLSLRRLRKKDSGGCRCCQGCEKCRQKKSNRPPSV